MTIGVASVNDAPLGNGESVVTPEDTAASGNVLANDTDIDGPLPLAVTQFVVNGATFAAGATASIAGVGQLRIEANGDYLFTPSANYNGAVPAATYTLSDGTATATAVLAIGVTPVNDAPVNTLPPGFTPSAGPVLYVLEDNRTAITGVSVGDADETSGPTNFKIATVQLTVQSGALSLTLAAGAAISAGANGSATLTLSGSQASINASLASLQYQGNANYFGPDQLRMVSTDGAGLTDTDTLPIVVSSVNDVPVAIADTAATDQNTLVVRSAGAGVLVNDSDVDTGDVLSVSAIQGTGAAVPVAGATTVAGSLGSLTIQPDGSYTYTPGAGAHALPAGSTAQDSFTYTLSDGHGGAASTTLTIAVAGLDDAASISGQSTGSVIEAGGVANAVAGTPTASGTLSVVDADPGQAGFQSPAPSSLNGVYGTFTFNASTGAWSYLLDNQRVATQALNNGTVAHDQLTVTSIDGSASRVIDVSINGADDAPVVASSVVAVSEKALPGANGPSGSTTASGTLVLSDVDNASLDVRLSAPATAITSGGQVITWGLSADGHTLTGSVGAAAIVVATVTNTGQYTVTLSGPIDDTANVGTEAFGIGVSVSDGSLSSTATLNVSVADDTPVIGTPAGAILFVGVGTVAVGEMNLSIGADSASGAKAVFAGTSVDAGGFITASRVDQTGTVVGTGFLTSHGSKLHYVSGADGSLSALDSSNATVFKVTGDLSSDHYTVTMLQALDQVQVTTTTFGSVSAGNAGAYSFSDGTVTFDLSARGYASNGSLSTVNTNSSVFGVANNFIDGGERLVFDVAAHGSGNASLVSGIGFTAQGLGAGESLTWNAYDAAHVLVGSGTIVGSGNGSTNNVSTTLTSSNFSGGSFSNIEFGAGAASSYKLALNSIVGNSEALKQVTQLAVHGVDSDNDSSTTQGIGLSFNSTGTIVGTSGTDALGGGAAADTLTGGAGNDILMGGAGNDTLTGGTGADTFAWKLADRGSSGAPALDAITDFDVAPVAAGGDTLDLRDLLVGASHVGTNPGNLDHYLDFDTSTAGTTVIRISSTGGFTNGNYAAASEDERITLQGVDLRSAFGLGAGASDNQIIQELLTRSKLVTDGP